LRDHISLITRAKWVGSVAQALQACFASVSSHLSPPKKDKYVSRLYYEIIITLILIKLIKIRDKYRQMSLMNVEEKL
jgi:hypothetical protein